MYTESTAPKDGDPYSAFTGSVAHIVFVFSVKQVDEHVKHSFSFDGMNANVVFTINFSRLAREDEEVDMVTVIPDAADEVSERDRDQRSFPSQTPLVPSRKTSFANRFGTTMKQRFGR